MLFRRNNATRYADAWCERSWSLPATGDPGTASIRLPYSAAAASSTYINPEGGSWLEIADEGGCGKWVGIVRDLTFNTDEVRISAIQPWAILSDRILHWERTYAHAVATGYIAAQVLTEALSGLPWFWHRYLGAAETIGPIVRGYEVNGQDAWSALTDMMELSGDEIIINAETGEVTWGGPLAGDLRQTTNLIADGNLRNWSYRANGSKRVSEVMVKRGTERYSVYSGATAAVYPGQATITAEDGLRMPELAAQELIRRQGVSIGITGAVGPELYSLRERDFPRVVVPRGRFTGAEHPCRLLSRSLSDDGPLMTLGLQVIDEAIGVRVTPPMRGGGASTFAGKGRGSFVQRQKSSNRILWDVWRAIRPS